MREWGKTGNLQKQESLNAGIFTMRNLKNEESLRAGIFKMRNL